MNATTARLVVVTSSAGAPLDEVVRAIVAIDPSLDVVDVRSSVDPGVGRDDLALAVDDADRVVVVHVVAATSGARRTTLADLDEAEWERIAEAPVWALIETLQVVAACDGRVESVVVVTESTGLSGAVGATAASTAAEAARAVVKSAARAWGADGPNLHLVAVNARLLGAGLDDVASVRAANRGEPSVGDLAEAVLAAADLPAGVGVSTLIVDGGRTLLP